jgi:2,3-dihydroxybenzoate---[aryl-carrier protein] ligase
MLEGCVPWPDEFAGRYRREGFWRGRTLDQLLHDNARSFGDRTALVAGERRISYCELDSRADRLAGGLRELGILADDRLVVQLPNVPELIVLLFALFRIGALPVMALPAHRRNEIAHLVDLSEAVAYVTVDRYQGFDYLALAEEIIDGSDTLEHVLVVGEQRSSFVRLAELDSEPPEPRLGDSGGVAFFLLSGGTTGLPKLIPRTHDDYDYNIRISAEVANYGPETVYLAALPVAHNFALGCPGVLGSLHAGGRAVLALSGSPDEAFPLIERERVTHSALVPPLALMWMDAAETTPHDLSSLKLLQVGGSKLAPEPARRIPAVLGCTLQQSFGMAEGLLSQTRAGDTDGVRIISQGRPISPADEVRIVDVTDKDLPAGKDGQLLVRGPYTIRGYYRSSEYNEAVFTEDGFLRTGDIVRATPGGNLIIEGRARDFINRGGDKVPAAEVEDHLIAHPAIREVALIAVPDEIFGEKTCACIVARGNPPSLHELKQFLRGRGLAPFKLPDRLEVLDALPRTAVGKVSKSDLLDQLRPGARSQPLRPERSAAAAPAR